MKIYILIPIIITNTSNYLHTKRCIGQLVADFFSNIPYFVKNLCRFDYSSPNRTRSQVYETFCVFIVIALVTVTVTI